MHFTFVETMDELLEHALEPSRDHVARRVGA
jgi:hypothetical protein